ncbi:mechanosensitive ion channel domain-containing protein [Neptunicella marina]|uniref:Small-conductance mechanosensitive channel n=1 Tax=Neptunicella marina TaxID=2125989 RepID=A0A8J6ISA7_9ALTE|nr:mechanosensitive ion channel domain-containing protein [Neptunicella marina]MBC3764488.1 mechanosensitive ion channel [Neptunicella marina]
MNNELFIQQWLPVVATIVFFAFVLWIANWLLFKRNKNTSSNNSFARQFTMLLLCLITMVAIVITLPLSDSTETQVLGLVGLVLSGLLAFSSTTVFSNLVAGALMRFTQPFRTGDFVRVNDIFGRVTERGLFDCEVQTENRDLISIPNNLMINSPITVTRSSGTIVSVSLSLGYDIHHGKVEETLKQAALKTGLEEPYVHITELGNFSVTYKISGLLTDVKSLLTTRSNLYCNVLDYLHQQGIEIMSPTFVSQHAGEHVQKKIPRSGLNVTDDASESVAEDIVFDKAEKAEQQEKSLTNLQARLEQLNQLLADADKEQKTALEKRIHNLKVRIDTIKSTPKEET